MGCMSLSFLCSRLSSWPPKSAKGWNVYSLFLAKSRKGKKRRSRGIEGFRNTVRSLLNGNGGDAFLLCNGLLPVCEPNSWRGIYRFYPTKLCQYLTRTPRYLKYLKEWKFVFNSVATLGDFCVFFKHQIVCFSADLCTETRPLLSERLHAVSVISYQYSFWPKSKCLE